MCAREIYWISYHETKGGGGLNCTGGGDGSYGWSRSKESRQKQSRTLRQRYPAKSKKPRLSAEEWAASRPRGSASGASKIDEAQATEIKRRLWLGEKHSEIAKDYCISKSAVSSINMELSWGHIPWPDDVERVVKTNAMRRAELSESSVREIRSLFSQGISVPEIARMTNRSDTQVRRVATGQRYKWVQ